MTTQTLTINEEKLHAFVGKMLGELGAVATGNLVLLGDELGFYRQIADHGPVTSADLASRTGTHERYVREWLSTMAAAGYVEYDADRETFCMTPEQTMILADENSPVLMTGGFYSAASLYADHPQLLNAFMSGGGIGWGDHDSCLFCGVEKFFRPGYEAHLTEEWLPALDGVVDKLERGAIVADVGCGHGASTMIMAKRFPNSRFFGFDFHELSIQHAAVHAIEQELDNVTFEVATAKSFPGNNYDLVTTFDCLHDMGDPAGASAHVRESLRPDGTWLIVEPMAGDSLAENLNPVGRIYYAFSAAVCTPTSLSQEVATALGAQAGEKRLREVVTSGGFRRFRRATETPFNMILEARP